MPPVPAAIAAPGSATPASPSPTAVAATRAPATPKPTATPDIDVYVAAAVATLRDPALAAEFELGGTTDIAGTEFDVTGGLVIAGSDMAGQEAMQPGDIRSSQISAGGKVYLKSGEARWIRDDQAPAAMPAFADAFMGEVTAGPWMAGSGPDEPAFQVNLHGVDLDKLLAATGMVDPGMTGAAGNVALFLSATGALQALVIEARATASQGLDPNDVLRGMAVTKLARVGDEGAPTVTAPKGFWLRHYSEDFAYLIEYPTTMKRSSADGVDHYRSKAPHDLMISAGTLREGSTLDSVVASEIKRLKGDGIKVTKDVTITLDGVPARKLTLAWTSGGKKYWAAKLMTVHESVIYGLTWVDLAARKKAAQPVLEEMLASFRSAY
ncbi:MAG: hypothetical protein QG587_2197 [Chloroflexota bacterium]|nr:hypothetical protein [Chloroflexota bacterium]